MTWRCRHTWWCWSCGDRAVRRGELAIRPWRAAALPRATATTLPAFSHLPTLTRPFTQVLRGYTSEVDWCWNGQSLRRYALSLGAIHASRRRRGRV